MITEIKSSRRLRPTDTNAEIDVLRALAMALTAAAGKMLSAEDIREAFIERSSMLISAEFVTAVVNETKSAEEETRALIRLAENVTGAGNKSQAAQWLIGAVTALRFEREMRSSGEPPMNRLGVLADLQRAIARVDLPEADRSALSKRLGDLGGLVEADANMVASVARSAMPAGAAPDPPAEDAAAGRNLAHRPRCRPRQGSRPQARQGPPEVRADPAKAPETCMQKLRPLMAQAMG